MSMGFFFFGSRLELNRTKAVIQRLSCEVKYTRMQEVAVCFMIAITMMAGAAVALTLVLLIRRLLVQTKNTRKVPQLSS